MTGCSLSPAVRGQHLHDLAQAHDIQITQIKTRDFTLLAAWPGSLIIPAPNGVLEVVIEGDGYAWVDDHTVSDNPTPRDPVGFRLAARAFPHAVYLARPCQYVTDPPCAPRYWSDDRFAPAVIRSYDAALTQLRAQSCAAHLHLIGYSGGAYIAVVLANQRADVAQVTTVAGLLDPPGWTYFHDISPLHDARPLAGLPPANPDTRFVHYCGTADTITPCALADAAIKPLPPAADARHRLIPLPGAKHETIWRYIPVSP